MNPKQLSYNARFWPVAVAPAAAGRSRGKAAAHLIPHRLFEAAAKATRHLRELWIGVA